MYTFRQINSAYEFISSVTFANGSRISFRKIEHVKADNIDGSYIFTMQGTSEETLDEMEPEDWDAIVLKFGKALYPYWLKVSAQGELLKVHDFSKIQKHWLEKRQEIIDYYNDYYIEKESNNYFLALKKEENFLEVIRKNMFCRLFFWQDNMQNQELEIRDFPLNTRLTTFVFQKGHRNDGGVCYESSNVHDEGSGRLIAGRCNLYIRRDFDGLPAEISLHARVEEQNTGFFSKELTIKRL